MPTTRFWPEITTGRCLDRSLCSAGMTTTNDLLLIANAGDGTISALRLHREPDPHLEVLATSADLPGCSTFAIDPDHDHVYAAFKGDPPGIATLTLDRETGILVTYGTTICGASAIATMSQVIKARATAIAVSVAVIVLYNVLAALAFPALGLSFGFTPETFGLWAGTAVNDTSSVVAAATSFDAQLIATGAVVGGVAASAYAVVVKLTRTLMLIPLAVFQQWFGNRGLPEGERGTAVWWRMVPGFLVLFLLAAALRTVGAIPDAAGPWLKTAAHLGTTIAMTGVGMSSSLRAIRAAGWRPLALGGILWALVALTALGLQAATGQLQFLR